jgi:hypothetical protein
MDFFAPEPKPQVLNTFPIMLLLLFAVLLAFDAS